MIENNILNVIEEGLCTGCGTCVSLCPKNAIKISIDSYKGIYLPYINEIKCNKCSTCFKTCPGHEVNFKQLNLNFFGKEPEDAIIGNYINCYVGHSLDDEIRYKSSSGGLVTQILISALENGMIDGALVTRMNRENPLEPEPFIARTKEEIIEASSSKYCPVPANIGLREILDSSDNEKFAVVGLPCHIHGIRKAELINKCLKDKIVLHLGIVCNHTPSFHATKFILKNNSIGKYGIKELIYRSEGWPGGMKIRNERFQEIFIPYFSVSYWGKIFNSFFFPKRCTMCTDKGCKLSDISFADAWLPKFMKRDSKGTSIIIVRNDIEINSKLENMINLHYIPYEIVYESQNLDKVKRKILANIKINNIVKRKTPNYIEKEIQIGINDYYSALIYSFKNYLSDSLFIVKIYMIFYEKAFKVKTKIFGKD